MRCRKMERGFVLVMVLLALVICGTILAAAARRSARSALAASAAQRDLQLRWGSLSCCDTVLARADDLMLNAPDRTAPELRFAPVLGGMTFRLILADEQAKVNANYLSRKGDYGVLESHLRRLQADAPEVLIVRLRPLAGEASGRKYTSLDQLFALRRPDALFDATEGAGPVVRQRVTCWGDGRVNLRRAEIHVMREALAGNLTESQLNALIAFRREKPDFTLKEAFTELALARERITALSSLATDESNCYSLWLSAESNARRWRRLYVTETLPHRIEAVNWAFSW